VVTSDVTLVDTNVLLDLVTGDAQWAEWSEAQLDQAALAGPIAINDVVYAEMSGGFDRIEPLDRMLEEMAIDVLRMSRPALFLAGKAFRRYRASGGVRTGVLSDFFIGAHAAVEDWALLTRDKRRYDVYFPTVRLLAPTA
jgi:predicted nucleic acid-binding protein